MILKMRIDSILLKKQLHTNRRHWYQHHQRDHSAHRILRIQIWQETLCRQWWLPASYYEDWSFSLICATWKSFNLCKILTKLIITNSLPLVFLRLTQRYYCDFQVTVTHCDWSNLKSIANIFRIDCTNSENWLLSHFSASHTASPFRLWTLPI